jgi:hypothetical protein
MLLSAIDPRRLATYRQAAGVGFRMSGVERLGRPNALGPRWLEDRAAPGEHVELEQGWLGC